MDKTPMHVHLNSALEHLQAIFSVQILMHHYMIQSSLTEHTPHILTLSVCFVQM